MGLVLVGVGFGYLVLTFIQVWSMSVRDGARSADAILVLGAAQYDCRPSPVLQERLDHALSLYEEGVADTIVTTGGKLEGDRCTEAQTGANYLRSQGVPDENILLEVQGTNTWQELAASARFLRERDLLDVVLVTDGYHALRVRAIADELGLEAAVSPSRRGGSAGELLEETAVVAVGRVIGFGRLVNIDSRMNS